MTAVISEFGLLTGGEIIFENQFPALVFSDIAPQGASTVFTLMKESRIQKRKHRKKRINKKWVKIYGYNITYEPSIFDSISHVENKLIIEGRF